MVDNETKEAAAERVKKRVRGRQITQSLLATAGKSIESFEDGKSPEELEAHYIGVYARLKRAGTG